MADDKISIFDRISQGKVNIAKAKASLPPVTDEAKEQADFIGFALDDDDDEEEDKPVRRPFMFEPDYQSVEVLLPLPMPPWVPDRRRYSPDMRQRLSQEIDDYLDYMRPTEAEHSLRQLTVQRISAVVVKRWPKARLLTFGSFETKLYLPSSDIDVVVECNECIAPHCLFVLRPLLQQAKVASNIEVISRAKVPIIKLVDSLTGFNVDISFNVTNGVDSAALVCQFVEDRRIGDAVRALMLLIKQFLVQRHLNEVFTGGLGSYGLLIMIVSFLRLHPRLQSEDIRPEDNLGILLMEFLELYGKHFNFAEVGIGLSTTDTWYFPRQIDPFSFKGRPSLLCLLDPQDNSNDVGRGSYNFQQIKHEFFRAAIVLQSMVGAGYEQYNDIADNKGRFRHLTDKEDDRHMVTILGSILTIDRKVLEHRDFVNQRYNDLQSSDPDVVASAMNNLDNHKTSPSPTKDRKRKRKKDNNHVFVEHDSGADSAASISSDSLEDSRGKKKRKRNKAYHNSPINDAGFNGHSPNSRDAIRTDGLGYKHNKSRDNRGRDRQKGKPYKGGKFSSKHRDKK